MGIGSRRWLGVLAGVIVGVAGCAHAPPPAPLPPAVPTASALIAPTPWTPERILGCQASSPEDHAPDWVVRLPGRPADVAVSPDGRRWVASTLPETEGARPGGSTGIHAYDDAGRRLWWRGRETAPRALVMGPRGEWTWTVNYDGSLTAHDRFGRKGWSQRAFCRPVPSPRPAAEELACFYDDDDARDGEWEARSVARGDRTRPLALPAGAPTGQALEISVSRLEPATGLMTFPAGRIAVWRGGAWPPVAPAVGTLLELGGMIREARPANGETRAGWALTGRQDSERELVLLARRPAGGVVGTIVGRRFPLGAWGDRLQSSARGDWALLADDRFHGQSVLAADFGPDSPPDTGVTAPPRAPWALAEARPAEFQMPFRVGERGAWVTCVGAGRRSRLAWIARDGRSARWFRLDGGEVDRAVLPVGLELLDPLGETALAWMDDGRVMRFRAPAK